MKEKHTRLLVLLAVIVLLVSMLGVAAYAAGTNPVVDPVCYEHGDVNADGAITGDDAVYLLFASFDMFKDDYPLEQSGDIDENNQFDGDDAVYLLFASFDMFKDQYPLKGTVHNYYDPIWTWNTDATTPTAQVSLKCACGQPHTVTEGIAVTPGTVIEPTCVTTGSKEFTATVTYNGTVFTNTVTVTIDALGTNGHEFNGTPTCKNGVKCENCDAVLPKLDHSYQLLDSEKVEGCKHTKRYQCSACLDQIDGTAEGDVYYIHNYTAKIEQEATCSVKGVKRLSCACGHSYTEDIEKNDSHTWAKGSTENGVTTYTCTCGQTKTVVEVAKDEAVPADTLKNNEVQLEGGTSVALDEKTADQLDANKTIKITVEAVKADEVQLDADKKEQIGQNDIYDFSMSYSDGTPISQFDGLVTVALPYTLQDGDDVNSIDVWYIADNGDVECVKGVYSNGYVTFQTDHFSYYTVTRLTPAQRCAVYGHVEVTTSKAPTCTEDGYTKVYCQRCSTEISQTKSAMLNHSYQVSEEKSKAATCDAAGLKVSVCQRCNQFKAEELKQLTHEWEKTETVAPDCTNKGYDKYTCALCQKEKTENEKEPTGHSWGLAENAWQWSEDNTKATVTLACRHDTHETPFTKVLTANITKSSDISPCLGGKMTYTATVYFNNEPYTDTKVDVQTGPGHTPDSKWESNNNQHYHLCSQCGEKVGAADHQWQRTVNTPASCKDGSATDKCVICDKTKTVVLPATGEHTYVNGVCSGCGQGSACDHMNLTDKTYDLAQYGACKGSITIRSCACGKICVTADSDFSCDFVEEEIYNEELNRYEYTATCKVCGLVQESFYDTEIDEDTCTGIHMVYGYLYKGDTLIVSVAQRESTFKQAHPLAKSVKIYNLADYGICAGTIEIMTCYCGERTSGMTDISCNFNYDEKTDTYVCSVCGVVCAEDYRHEKAGCNYIEYYDITYSKNNVEILSMQSQHYYAEHNTTVQSYKLYGETCEDGICISTICTDCGMTDTYYSTWCMESKLKQTIDTTGVGFCTDAIEVYGCPCGQNESYYLAGDGYHDWNFVSRDDSASVYVCSECNYTKTVEETVDDKEGTCEVVYTENTTFTDDKGHRFAVSTRNTRIEHDIKETAELLGETCEDGVRITEACKNCDYTYTWVAEHHYAISADSLELTGYGCGDLDFDYRVCACGKEHHVYRSYDCHFMHYDTIGDENGYIELYRCSDCGMIRESYEVFITPTNPCYSYRDITEKFYMNEQLLGQFHYINKYVHHDYLYTMSLNPGASDCSGGWSALGTCVHCGETNENSGNGCHTYPVFKETVSTADMCGQLEKVTYRCACGKESHIQVVWADGEDSCEFTKEIYDEELEVWVQICETCGSSYYTKRWETPVEGTTCEILNTAKHVYRNPAGDTIITEVEEWTSYDHYRIYHSVRNGETCADGYELFWTCADCGESSDYDTRYDCDTYLVGRELLYENDAICAPIYVDHYSCACGAEQYYTYSENDHHFTWNIAPVPTCIDCGLSIDSSTYSSQIPNSCRASLRRRIDVHLNGTTVATAERTWEETNHIRVYTFQFNGDSCEDGYTYSYSCLYCDYSETYDDMEYGHNARCVAYYAMPEGSCGGYAELYACACGENTWSSFSQNCEFDYLSEEDFATGYIRHYRCNKCGLVEEYQVDYLPSDDPCKENTRYTYTYYRDDQMLLTFAYTCINNSHAYVYSYDMYGQTCDEGYDIHRTCLDCGYTEICNTQVYGCEANRISREKVYENESICAPVYMDCYRCACGAEESYGFDMEDHNSRYHNECQVCGLVMNTDSGYNRLPNTCRVNAYVKARIYLNDTLVHTAEKTWQKTQHVYLTSYSMAGDSCEDGYTYSSICLYCDATIIDSEIHTGHNRHLTQFVQLPESSCGGYIEVSSCACGENCDWNFHTECNFSNSHYTETDENGILHEYLRGTCTDCGMKDFREIYTLPSEDPCYNYTYVSHSYTLGDWEQCVNYHYTSTNHDYEIASFFLPDGVTDCEDGIACTMRCVKCGDEYDTHYNYHRILTLVKSFDLSQYGSVCGGTLNLMQCPCGKYQDYVLSEDTHCDLDNQTADCWIENAIHTAQHTTEGYFETYSYAHNHFCAVTDPACSLKLRSAIYWLSENCTAVEYEIWEYYDAETETWITIGTAETGRTHTYHTYTYTDFDEVVDGKRNYGGRYVCPDCGSTYAYTYYHDADGNEIKYVSEAVNTLNNGENKQKIDIYEYVIINGYRYYSTERYETVHADGTEYWYQNAFTYDFTDGCYRTQVYTDSDGNTQIHEKESAHNESWHYETLKESTCTQPGEYISRYICNVCKQVTREYVEQESPDGHNWGYDNETEQYFCFTCGLENQNGASGSIVMEDMTDDFAEGNYVIGYWNRNQVTFTPYVSLILYNAAEDENDELVLTNIDFTYLTIAKDGICGLEFSQEAVAAAAADALAESGYTGTYAVRISFVAMDGELDYAITFDTQTAA